jgi:hypothetical protein
MMGGGLRLSKYTEGDAHDFHNNLVVPVVGIDLLRPFQSLIYFFRFSLLTNFTQLKQLGPSSVF